MTMTVEGIDEVFKAFDQLGAAGKRGANYALQRSVQRVRTDAIQSIQKGPKTGRIYERGPGQNLSQTHQASAPGEAPATDTGRLVSSIKAAVQGYEGTVSSELDYAYWLEFGTMKMEARPFLRPALANNEDFIIESFAKALEAATDEFNK